MSEADPLDAIAYARRGDCLFPEPFLGKGFDMQYWHGKLPPLWEKVRLTDNDRAFVIMSALLVEHGVDDTLSVWMPRYRKLMVRQDFTFSMKIQLLDSMCIVPKFLTTACDFIRKIRNEFAHKFDIESLEQVKSEHKQILGQMSLETTPKKFLKTLTTRLLMSNLILTVLLGLEIYRQNLSFLRADIASEQYMAGLSRKLALSQPSE